MNTMLKEYMGLKNISDADEFFSLVKQKGFEIPSGTILDVSAEAKAPLYSKLEEASFVLAYHALPVELRSEADLDALLKDSKIKASCLYVYFSLPSPKPLYLITKEASAVIESTHLTEKLDLAFCQEFLPHPYFIYSNDDAPLFDDVNSIALYIDETKTMTCHIGLTNGHEFARNVDLRKDGAQLEEKVDSFQDEEYIIEDATKDKLFKAAIYIAKFILLLKAEKQPLFVEAQYREKKKPNKAAEKKMFGNISYKKVSLTHTFKKKLGDVDKLKTHDVFDKEGKTLRIVPVIGHIRMQAYGPGWSLHRPIYIEAHESKAWKKDGIQLVKVVE